MDWLWWLVGLPLSAYGWWAAISYAVESWRFKRQPVETDTVGVQGVRLYAQPVGLAELGVNARSVTWEEVKHRGKVWYMPILEF